MVWFQVPASNFLLYHLRNIVECFPPMQDLVYRVRNRANRGQKLEILKCMTGYFDPHQMSAIMGPSGSGKSTLMDVLAGRKTQGTHRVLRRSG